MAGIIQINRAVCVRTFVGHISRQFACPCFSTGCEN